MVQALRSVQWASANKSSLATIFANPIYRGPKIFNFGRLVLPRLDALEYDCSDHRAHLGGSIHGTLTTLGIEDLLTMRPTLAIPRLCHNA